MESQVSGVVTSTVTPVPAEDHVTTYGWKALAGSAIGYSMDGFDMLILGFMLAAISAEIAVNEYSSGLAGNLDTGRCGWTLVR